MKENIEWRVGSFEELSSEQLAALPGKITRLHDRWRNGIAVPSKGFVIFPVAIAEIAANEGVIPAMLKREVLAAYRSGGFEQDGIRVAVRGALSVEDRADASWAGGSESPTNILGETAFLQAIRTCVTETLNGKMDGYRASMGFGSEMELSILVHEMAVCDRFAVVFTRNPMTGNPNEIVVQATFGGGQLLTGGEETGDVFVLDKQGNVLSRSVTTKRQLVTVEGTVPMPTKLQDASSLDDSHLRSLTDFVLRVEALEDGIPQDCEVALEVHTDGAISPTLVQNRPVTALGDSPGLVRYQAIASTKAGVTAEQSRLEGHGIQVPEDVFSDQNIAELLTQHPTPFSFGLFTYIFAHGRGAIRVGRNMMGYEIGDELDRGFFKLIGSQPRCSIVHDAFTYRIAGIPLTDYASGLVRRYLDLIRQDERLANYPEVVLYDQNPSRELLSELYGKERAALYHKCYDRFFTGIRRWEEEFGDRYLQEYEPGMAGFLEEQSRLSDLSLSQELVESLQAKLDFLRTKVCVWFVIVARLGFFAYARLRRTLEAHFEPAEAKQLLDRLTAGLSDDPTVGFNIELAALQSGATTRDAVLGRFGHLGFNELEISGPRYREQPEVIDQLAGRIKGDPRAELQSRSVEYEAARASVCSSLEGTDERGEFERDVASARRYLALRERVKFNYLKVYDLIRRQLLRTEALLGWPEGRVFFLDPREIRMLVEQPDQALQFANSRFDLYQSQVDMEVPQVMFTDQLSQIGVVDIPEGAAELYGIGVTSFVAEGPAVVVRDPNDKSSLDQMSEGCVLVSHTTDPTWAPVIGAVGEGGGLITEVGGPLAHGAITSRELGIAAVLNVQHATKVIKTGQRVRVDGPAGKVYILN